MSPILDASWIGDGGNGVRSIPGHGQACVCDVCPPHAARRGMAHSFDPMALRIARALGEHPLPAFEFCRPASEVVDDFGDFGPVLQADRNGDHTDRIAVLGLRVGRDQRIRLVRAADGMTGA